MVCRQRLRKVEKNICEKQNFYSRAMHALITTTIKAGELT